MTKTIFLSLALMFVCTISKAQTVMQLKGVDCNGNSHDLMADLDAGKAVILHFFMPSCGSCPPPAQKIQKMAKNILAKYPGMITAYALPFQNSTTCTYTSTWVSSNNLSLYAPFDSGAAQVANYGGFGMPTVVLLGGKNHRVMFSSMSFSTGDTTEMRDSILALIAGSVGIADPPSFLNSFDVFPNPASDNISIHVDLKESSTILVEVMDIAGMQVAVIMNEKLTGMVNKQFSTALLPSGNYLVRLSANGQVTTQKLSIAH
ncbi:MAG: T9SS type A sorting domain-containing protein [Flavobacteriaceae bacterium]|nr:T9SS type A sorting domain-containing protein [Flavobacteriaceae bacterium]